MPLTAEQTKTLLEDTDENPNQDQSRTTVHVTLIFDGVDFEPKELYDALDDKYTTVASERDTVSHGNYVFKVSA